MNVRLYEEGISDMVALQAALQAKTFTGGALRYSSVSAMIDVSFVENRSPLMVGGSAIF